MVARVLIVVAIALLAGCEKRSALYCERNPEDLANCEQMDAPPPDLVACTMDVECGGGYCELGASICVECLLAEHCEAGELCDVDSGFKCRGCLTDADCAGGTCLPDGSCADDTIVIQVSETGIDNPGCSFASPCATLDHALTLVTEPRKYLRVTGSLTENIVVTQDVELLGAGATLTPASNGVVLEVDGAIVKVHGLTIACNGDQDGIDAKGNSTLTLDRVTISGCDHEAGVDLHGGVAVITRSNIHDNPAGGIRSDGAARFNITNNWVHHNGTALGGGFGLSLQFDSAEERRVEFNTIADNETVGLDCKKVLATPNNIIGGNGLLGGVNVTGCVADGSLVTDNLAPLAFMNRTTAPYDYHIMETSTAKDAATVTSTVADDYDRELRPHGVAKDFGADEYRGP